MSLYERDSLYVLANRLEVISQSLVGIAERIREELEVYRTLEEIHIQQED